MLLYGSNLKAKKCRSLSMLSGSPKNLSFQMPDQTQEGSPIVSIKTLKEDPHKFLGSLITYTNNSGDHFKFLSQKLKFFLENINTCLIRGEGKLKIYERYVLPSMRYHLAIHNITKCQLNSLDKIGRSYIKKWSNFLSHRYWHFSSLSPGYKNSEPNIQGRSCYKCIVNSDERRPKS